MPFRLSQFAQKISLLVVGGFVMLPLTSCKPPVKELPEAPEEIDDTTGSSETQAQATGERLPLNRTIHDINGRPLDVRIIGRANTVVRMTRLEDNYKFDFPIAQLSQKDRRFILQFPESILSPLTQAAAPAGRKSGEAPYIKTRQDEIDRIIKDIQRLTAELRAIEPNTSRARTQQKKIDAKEMEILHLESQIETYRQNNRPK